MKLTNFEINGEDKWEAIELLGFDQVWDLHNGVDFAGVELLPEFGAVRLRWVEMDPLPDKLSHGFSDSNPARWCSIRFDGVSLLRIMPATGGSDYAPDAKTLHGLSMVAPLERTSPEHVAAGVREPDQSEAAHLLFEFLAGFDIEVCAATATLESDFGGSSHDAP